MMYFIPGVLLHPIRRSQRSVADIYLPDEDRCVVSSLILPLAPGSLGRPPAPPAQRRIQDRCTATDLRPLGLMKLFETCPRGTAHGSGNVGYVHGVVGNRPRLANSVRRRTASATVHTQTITAAARERRLAASVPGHPLSAMA